MRVVISALLFFASGVALAQVGFGTQSTTTRTVFMSVPADGRYFLGRLPKYGEVVDIVFVGKDGDTGHLNFQLRVRP